MNKKAKVDKEKSKKIDSNKNKSEEENLDQMSEAEEEKEIDVELLQKNLEESNEEIEIHKEKLTAYEDMIKRNQAEFDNYRKRTIKERQESIKYEGLDIFKDILPIIDNFDRALEFTKDKNDLKLEVKKSNSKENFVDGIQLIAKNLSNLLEKYHVVESTKVGMNFDPNKHQAIQFEEKEGLETEEIAEIYQKGYLLHDKVLRLSTVKTFKPKS